MSSCIYTVYIFLKIFPNKYYKNQILLFSFFAADLFIYLLFWPGATSL